MARYDVYPNPSASAGQGLPYVVVMQSDVLDGLPTRLCIPLSTEAFAGPVPAALCPGVTVKGQRLVALAHYLAPLPAKALRQPVANLAAQAHLLVGAVDAALSGV